MNAHFSTIFRITLILWVRYTYQDAHRHSDNYGCYKNMKRFLPLFYFQLLRILVSLENDRQFPGSSTDDEDTRAMRESKEPSE